MVWEGNPIQSYSPVLFLTYFVSQEVSVIHPLRSFSLHIKMSLDQFSLLEYSQASFSTHERALTLASSVLGSEGSVVSKDL